MSLSGFSNLSAAYSFPVQSRTLPIELDLIGVYHTIGSYLDALPDTGTHGQLGLTSITKRGIEIDGISSRDVGLIGNTSRAINVDGAIK